MKQTLRAMVTDDPGAIPAHLVERFWSKVDRTSTPEGCWLWQGRPDVLRGGYGAFGANRLGTIGTHRLSYALTHGAIPKGFYVCHRCDVPLCVAPHHLYLGTALENMADKYHRGRNRATRHAHFENRVYLRLNEIAKARGLSIRDVEAMSGVPFPALQNIWRNQNVYVELSVLSRLSEVLEVEPGELFRRVA